MTRLAHSGLLALAVQPALELELLTSRLELNDVRVHDISLVRGSVLDDTTVGRGGEQRNRPVGRD
jgi:hypothetical protein